MAEPACGRCRWFSDTAVADGDGECRIRPPVFHPAAHELEQRFAGFWPAVEADDWCGEFQEKPAPPELTTPITYESTGLSVQLRNRLRRENITTLEQLTQKTACDLLAIRNFGYMSLAEIEKMLESKGLCLLGREPAPASEGE